MADFWIVSNQKFMRHWTFAAAEQERDHLAGKHRDQKLRVYRCKTDLNAGDRFGRMAKLLSDAKAALTGPCDDALRLILLDDIDAMLTEVKYKP